MNIIKKKNFINMILWKLFINEKILEEKELNFDIKV